MKDKNEKIRLLNEMQKEVLDKRETQQETKKSFVRQRKQYLSKCRESIISRERFAIKDMFPVKIMKKQLKRKNLY